MIVQCDHCSAKYRIPDEKIKGRGVKVKCAKCQNVFTVEPPEASLQSAAAKQPKPAPPEPPVSEPADAARPAASGAFQETAPPQPPAASMPEQPADSEQPAGEPQQPPGLSFEEAFRDGQTIEFTSPSPPPGAPAPPAPPPAAPETEAAAGRMDWGNISLGEQTVSEGPAAGRDFGLSGAGQGPGAVEERLPRQPAPFPAAPGPAGEEVPPPAPSKPATRVSAAVAEPSRGGGRKVVAVLLFLAILGAGGYYAFPRVYPAIMGLLGRGPAAEQGPPLAVEGIVVTAVRGASLVAVRGTVRNTSESNKGMIRVEAQFKDAGGQVLKRAAAYCGNTFTDEELAARPAQEIRSALENELGQSLRNSSIPPGKSVPFLVVLEDPPLNIQQVTVAVLEWKNTT